MQASLIVVDGIATNRVALKVKLASAWYDVAVAATGADALSHIASERPNLVVVNDTLPDLSIAEFCTAHIEALGQDAPPVLALCEDVSDRTNLLELGVEDILPMPIDSALLVARIRSVLRAHASEAEWRLRDGTNRALGFAEAPQAFAHSVPVLQLNDPTDTTPEQVNHLNGHPGLRVTDLPLNVAMREITSANSASVVIIDLPRNNPEPALGVISDLRANASTRHTAILVAVPQERTDLAARALDLGANETTFQHASAKEKALRVRRLHSRCEISNRLRNAVRSDAEASIRDPLTGLYNRRYAMPYLDRIAEQAKTQGRPFAVMIADLDHFKQINDWHGHAAGDAVLSQCADRFSQNMRAFDLVARIGGEEFLFVLPSTDLGAARQAAMRLCRMVAEQPFILPATEQEIHVTVSIGLAMGEDDNRIPADLFETLSVPERLLHSADKALYRAKEQGRNRYILGQTSAA